MRNILNIIATAVVAVSVLGACSKMDNLAPQGGNITSEQLEQTTTAIPERADALFTGMYTKLGDPLSFGLFSSNRPDDFSFIMMAFSNDLEAADMTMADNDYNWFSICGDLSSRNADYANPYIRYRGVYDEIGRTQDVINAYGEITESTPDDIRYKVAQAYALRAFSYMNIAPYFQFNYQIDKTKPCVPLVNENTTDFTNNPRASVEAIYEQIISDLNIAIENLEGYQRPDKSKIDQKVAYGLRARAELDMGLYAEAAADAALAAEGFTPASIKEVSTPSFYDINDHNWIWGYDMTSIIASRFIRATSSSWVRSFCQNAYSTGTGNYCRINKLLYDKIPDTDVRKGWWVDEDLYSPLLDGLTWGEAVGQEIPTYEITNQKTAFVPYTNVKFGTASVGNIVHDEDWPFMRVEEMILIQAEGLIKSENESKGIALLNDFVKTYRDPAYDAASTGLTIENEVWKQRRIELWGEGFSNADTRRLNKPLVRFHDKNTTNFPAAFAFNMTNNDGWWLMRFCTDEINTNLGLGPDNEDGTIPVMYQNPELRDGVTD